MTAFSAMKGDRPGVWDDTSETFTPIVLPPEQCPACWARVGHTPAEYERHHPKAGRAADAAPVSD